ATVTAITQGLLDLAEARAVKPHVVRQVRRTHGLNAFGVRPVADYAIGGEDLLTLLNVTVDAFRNVTTGKAANVASDVANAFFADYIFPRRHHGLATAKDGGLDGFRFATVQPVMVGQVGEAIGALGIGAMADRAVGGEQASTHFQGLRILGDFLDRHSGELGVQRAVLLIGPVHFALPFLDLGPTTFVTRQQAFPVAEAGVERQIAKREYHGGDEQH